MLYEVITGAFAEFIALPMSNVWEHRPGIDLDIAAIFDPFGNAVHTALQFDLVITSYSIHYTKLYDGPRH